MEWHRILKWIIVAGIAVIVLGESGCSEKELPLSITPDTTTVITPTITVPTSDHPTPTASPTTTMVPIKTMLLIDHTCTNIQLIPRESITQAKAKMKVLYFHSSHGNQISVGMDNLQKIDHLYNYDESGSDGGLLYRQEWTDLGTDGDTTWVDTTKKALNDPENSDISVVMWSWCSGMSINTETGVNTYLEAMDTLEKQYPKITFIYMTGHLDGTGVSGNLNVRNNQIRQWCKENKKILFDFADIESYNPDNNYFLDKGASDDCSYDGGNWAEEWVTAHPSHEMGGTGYFEHTHVLNCNLKGSAFWWMMAKIAVSHKG